MSGVIVIVGVIGDDYQSTTSSDNARSSSNTNQQHGVNSRLSLHPKIKW
jgi:hypothetical protein